MRKSPGVKRWLLSAAVMACTAPLALAQQAAVPAPAPVPGGDGAAAAAAASRRVAPQMPDLATVTQDMQAVQGLFTIYRYNPADVTKDQSRLLAQIPRSLLKQDLLLATSVSRGERAGWPGETLLVRFEIVGRSLVITVPDSRFLQNPTATVTDAVTRTYTSSFIATMPIITIAGGDPVVDLSGFLMSGFGVGGAPRRDLSTYTKVKAFPDNALIDVDLAMPSRMAPGAGQSIGVTFAFRRLPALGSYQPRVADERVGYFTTVRQDWATRHSEREMTHRYVNRWDIKKKDPTLELSPPDKPIVFVIEKTVPLQWRKWVAEGILEWNKAYEKLGITGAIVVQQQTEDNEFANVDPEDARYNFIRWIVSGRAFAMGPSRPDPRTGQLLDADIIFDDSMLRHYAIDFQRMGPRAMLADFGPEFATFLEQNPAFLPQGMTIDQVRTARREMSGELLHEAPAARPAADRLSSTAHNRHASCSYAEGLKHQIAMTTYALAATRPGKPLPDRFVGEIIREVVAHEVGHTLGLRHNFKASSWLSMEEIKKRRDTTDEPTASSVMDYNPVLFFQGDTVESVRHFISPAIGPYDYWAIEYGYKTPTAGDGSEKAMLKAIASRNTQPELAYATDEDTMGLTSPDPMVNRFDYSNDPVGWAKTRVALVDDLLKDLKKWAVKENEPGAYLLDAYLRLTSEKARNMNFVARLVGGQSFTRARPSDPNYKSAFTLLEPKKQRDALTWLSQTIFRDDFLAADAELLNDLAPSRWDDWASNAPDRLDFAAHQAIISRQAQVMLTLCSPTVLQRVYDAELKSKSADKFTAAELIASVRDMTWNLPEVKPDTQFGDGKPALSSVRRNLQKQHLQYLLALAESETRLVSPDLQSMARFAARELSDRIESILEKAKLDKGSRLDFATRAHLTEAKSHIDRVLNAPHMKTPAASSGPMIIIHGNEAAPAVPPEPRD